MELHLSFAVWILISIKTILSEQPVYQQNPAESSIPSNYDEYSPQGNKRTNNFENYESNNYNGRPFGARDSNDINKDEDDDWSTVPGIAGKDYPNHRTIPQTSFTCADKKPGGYYADMETGCQVFHVCNARGVKSSFLCSPGSIFNQKYFVCDWWYDVECDNASELYSLNDQLTRGDTGSDPAVSDHSSYINNNNNNNNNNNHENNDRNNFNAIDYPSANSGFDISNRQTNRSTDLTQIYASVINGNSEQANFTWQQIDSGNREENAPSHKGSDINYLSTIAKDWRPSFAGDVAAIQSFNEKARPSFNDERRISGEKRDDLAREVLPNERRVLDNVPRGFAKAPVSKSKHSDLQARNNANYFNQEEQNYYDRLNQNNRYLDNKYPENLNSRDNRYQTDLHGHQENANPYRREQTNSVYPFNVNQKDEYFNRRPEEFITPPAAGQNVESFNKYRDNYDKDTSSQRQTQVDVKTPVNSNNDYERFQNNKFKSNNEKSEPGIVYADSKNDDDFERIRQKEIDDAVLCKNHKVVNNKVTNQADFRQSNLNEFDVEANRLTYEQPPLAMESIYSQYNKLHNNEDQSDNFSKPPFPPEEARGNPTSSEKIYSSNNRKDNNLLLKSRARPTGGFRNGLGNGFPSSNKELVGSNTIAGARESKLSTGQHPDYPPFGNRHISQFGLDVNSLSH